MTPNPSTKEFNFDTKILRYLVGIVEEGSLSQAAQKFYISQPALSRYLKQVEDSLNVQLFTHTNHHLEPTDAGKVFLNGARSILYAEETALTKIANARQRDHYLEIWTEEFFLSELKDSIVPLFNQAYPDIQIKITTGTSSDIRQNLMNGIADFGLFWGDEIDSPFFTGQRLFQSEFVFCSPERNDPSAPIPAGRIGSWLPSETKLLLSPKNSYIRHMQDQILKEQGVHSPQIGGELSLAFLRELLRSGYGNTILPKLLAAHWISESRISPIIPIYTCCAMLGEYQGHAASEATLYFKQLIQERIKDELL